LYGSIIVDFMPSQDSIRKRLTGQSSIKGKVEWFGDWVKCTADRFSDTEVRLQVDIKAAAGDLTIIKGLGFPFDGVHEIGEGMTIAFEESHGIESAVDCFVGIWQSWNVYNLQIVEIDSFLRMHEIAIERQVLKNRPQLRAQEQAILASQVTTLITLASELEGFDTSVAMAKLGEFLSSDRTAIDALKTVETLLETNSLALAKVADRLRAEDYNIDQKKVQMEVFKEMMPRLEALGNIDFSTMHKLQQLQRDDALAEIKDDREAVELISEEAELLCMMPKRLLSSHAEMSRLLQDMVLEVHEEIKILDNKESEGKSQKATRKKAMKTSAIVS
jgi:hypothetical protein